MSTYQFGENTGSHDLNFHDRGGFIPKNYLNCFGGF